LSQTPSRSTLLRLLREAVAWDRSLELDEPEEDRVTPEWRSEAEEILVEEEAR
jgi:hypothetical protein